jgi:SAM-dependent methyltransferase
MHTRQRGPTWPVRGLLNVIRQTAATSAGNWPKLPGELVWFARGLREYRSLAADSAGQVYTQPILFQRGQIAFDAHYTFQAAWATRHIVKLAPRQHVDISSDLRFVTQLAALVPVLYVEYRSTNISFDGLRLQRGDIVGLPFAARSLTSITCLHVVEHVGLGRYGEPLDVRGSQKALAELSRVLAPGGSLFLSLPVGRCRTMFNAHRIFDPVAVPGFLPRLECVEFSVVTSERELLVNTDPGQFIDEDYACGLYWFRRP